MWALLEKALDCGVGVLEFWDLTPKETVATIKARVDQLDRERKQRSWLAWHIAAFMRTKRLPSLLRILGGGKTRKLEGEELEKKRAEHADIMTRMDVGEINQRMQRRKRKGR